MTLSASFIMINKIETSLLAMFAKLMILNNMKVSDIKIFIFSHPSYSEIISSLVDAFTI